MRVVEVDGRRFVNQARRAAPAHSITGQEGFMESAGTRGFAGLSPERRLEISRKGGRMAHIKGTARQWTKETARAAAMIAVNNRRAKQAQTAVAV